MLAVSLAIAACGSPQTGNTLVEGDQDIAHPFRNAFVTGVELDKILASPFTSIDTFTLTELTACGVTPGESHSAEAQLAKAFAGDGDNIVVETIAVFSDAAAANAFVSATTSAIDECGGYSSGGTEVDAEKLEIAPAGDRIDTYRLRGPDNTPQRFAGTEAFVVAGNVVVSISVANVAGKPFDDTKIAEIVSLATSKVETAAADAAGSPTGMVPDSAPAGG